MKLCCCLILVGGVLASACSDDNDDHGPIGSLDGGLLDAGSNFDGGRDGSTPDAGGR
jgi:hypothetical protein